MANGVFWSLIGFVCLASGQAPYWMEPGIMAMSLRDIKGVELWVEEAGPEGEKGFVGEEELATKVTRQIMDAGIKILLSSDRSSADGNAALHIHVIVVKAEACNAYLVRYYAGINQSVELRRDQDIRGYAVTWMTGGIGLYAPDTVQEGVRDGVGKLIEEFIRAYRLANKK
jgi:hypothetical protein